LTLANQGLNSDIVSVSIFPIQGLMYGVVCWSIQFYPPIVCHGHHQRITFKCELWLVDCYPVWIGVKHTVWVISEAPFRVSSRHIEGIPSIGSCVCPLVVLFVIDAFPSLFDLDHFGIGQAFQVVCVVCFHVISISQAGRDATDIFDLFHFSLVYYCAIKIINFL